MSKAEAANPTSHPMSVDEIAAYMQEQNDQDRRDYYMVEGKQKILQDALNKMCSWSKNDTLKHEKPEQANPTARPLPWSDAHVPLAVIKASLAEANEYFTKPSHYNDTAITPFQVIDDWNLDFYLGNVVKYVCRREKKGNELADLRKALAYLAEKIKQLERAE